MLPILALTLTALTPALAQTPRQNRPITRPVALTTKAPTPPQPAVRFSLYFQLEPSYQSTTQTLKNDGTQFHVTGPSLLNAALTLRAAVGRSTYLDLRFARNDFTVAKATVSTFTIRESSAAFYSVGLIASHCMRLERTNSICPRIGIGLNSIFLLEFKTNTQLELESLQDILVNFGVAYEQNLGPLKASLSVDYRPGFATGQSDQTVWSSHSRFDFGLQLLGAVGRSRHASWFIGANAVAQKSKLTITSDEWAHSSMAYTGIVGLRWRFTPPPVRAVKRAPSPHPLHPLQPAPGGIRR